MLSVNKKKYFGTNISSFDHPSLDIACRLKMYNKMVVQRKIQNLRKHFRDIHQKLNSKFLLL